MKYSTTGVLILVRRFPVFDYVKRKLGRTGLLSAVWLTTLLIALSLHISQTNIELVVFKFLIFCPAVLLVHAIRKTLFPYVDLKDLIDGNDCVDAATVLGVFLFYIGMTYILVSAI